MRPISITNFLLLIAASLLMSSNLQARAQSTAETQSKSTGSISGTIKIAGKPAAGMAVVICTGSSANIGSSLSKVLASTQTASDGTYTFTGLAAASYQILPGDATAALPANTFMYTPNGKAVILGDNEHATGIDFALQPGGVITGRVTDSRGQPLISTRVTVEAPDDRGNLKPIWEYRPQEALTDDRGIYRIYGIAAGKYKVSVDRDPTDSPGKRYPKTYSPGVTDPSTAAMVEVSSGSENKSVDIVVGGPVSTYTVRGMLVDGESGKGLPNMSLRYSSRGARVDGSQTTDATGNFQIAGLSPGHYEVSLDPFDQSGYYMDGRFDVSDSDIDGVEVKLLMGATVAGTVSIGSAADQTQNSRITDLPFSVMVIGEKQTIQVKIFYPAADGSFQLSGISPGQAHFQLSGGPATKGFSIAQLSREGSAQPVLKVAAGEHINGVQIVLAYGTGTIRGVVTFTGNLPEGAGMGVVARSTSPDGTEFSRGALADSQGHFQIDGVPDGEYRLLVTFYGPVTGVRFSNANPPIVTVAGGQTVDVQVRTEIVPVQK